MSTPTARAHQQSEHDKRTARLAFERSQKKGVTQSGAPITRMNWLYQMVTAHGEFQEYSDFARSWIQGRQANADLTQRHDRRRSSWWEIVADPNATAANAANAASAAAGTAAAGTAPTTPTARPQVPGTPTAQVPPSTPTASAAVGGAGVAGAAVGSGVVAGDDIVMRDVLGNAIPCDEFRRFCAPHSFYIDFLQSVDNFKKKCFDSSAPNADSFKVADLMAKRIFSQFLSDEDKKGAGPPILMPADVARAVVNKLRKTEGQTVDAVMFDSIYNSVYDSLSKNQFPVFMRSPAAAPHIAALRKAKADRKAQIEAAAKQKQTDDQALVAAKRKAEQEAAQKRAIDDSKSKMSAVHAQIGAGGAPATAVGATGALGPMSRRDSQITVALPSFLSGNYRRDVRGWEYKYKFDKSGAEYKTLQVDIHGIRGKDVPQTPQQQKDKSHVLVSVDSKTLKCSPKPPYKDQVQFQLTASTQFVELSYWRKGKFLAYVVQPIREIVENPQRAEQPLWYKLDAPSANPNVKAKDPETELQVSYKLWTSPPAENSKDHEQLEDDEGTSSVANLIRGKVSLKKRRFQMDGFDLDLTYVTDRIIAMGYPSEGTEGVYRNKLTSVQRFFARRHPNCFRLYNLCSERVYDAAKFDMCVARFPFDDHNPPAFTLLKEFCKDVHTHLADHPQNVAAIHCKAGKGRTGTVIACYLMYSRLSVDAESALNFFGVQRTKNNKGVTIPSQIRYVHYFDRYCRIKRRGGQPPGRTTLFLQTIYFRGIPHDLKSANSSIWFTIEQRADPSIGRDKKHVYSSKGQLAPIYHKRHATIQFDSSKKLITLNEDVLFTFFHGGIASNAKMFEFWINTRFVETTNTGALVIRDDDPLPYGAPGSNPMLQLKKKEIDKADKDKKHKKYPADFRVELVFAKTVTAAEVLPKELAQANQIVKG